MDWACVSIPEALAAAPARARDDFARASGYCARRMIPIQMPSLFCLLSLSLAAVAQDHDLRVPTKKGATVWLAQESKLSQTIDMGGQEMETGRQVTTIAQFTVTDVDDKGNLVVETKVARIHGSMTIPMMGDVEFDSAKSDAADGEEDTGGFGMPSPGAIAKSQTALAGKSFVAKVGPNGKVVALEGVEELLQAGKNKKGNPMLPGGPNEAELRSLVESAFGMVPEKPMAVGTSWDHKTGDGAGTYPSTMKLTLAKVDADAFEISAAGTVDAPKPAGEGDDPRRKMMESLKIGSSKIEGSQRVSRQDGFVIAVSQTMTMDAAMDGPMGGEVSMQIQSTTTVKRTTAEAAMPAKAEAATPPKPEPAK